MRRIVNAFVSGCLGLLESYFLSAFYSQWNDIVTKICSDNIMQYFCDSFWKMLSPSITFISFLFVLAPLAGWLAIYHNHFGESDESDWFIAFIAWVVSGLFIIVT